LTSGEHVKEDIIRYEAKQCEMKDFGINQKA
jgi:hypothetical protein